MPQGETHTSSAQRAPYTGQSLRAGNRLDAPLSNFVAPPLGLGSPEFVNAVDLCVRQTLYEPVSQTRPRLARQSKRLSLDLLNRHGHALYLTCPCATTQALQA